MHSARGSFSFSTEKKQHERGGGSAKPSRRGSAAGVCRFVQIFGEFVGTCACVCRGRCPHRPGRMHRFYENLRRIRNFPTGRCGHRPLQTSGKMLHEFADRLLRIVTACCPTSQALRASSPSKGSPGTVQIAELLQASRERSRVYLKTPDAPGQRAFSRRAASFFLEIRQYSCEKMSCAARKFLAASHVMSFQIHPKKTEAVFLVALKGAPGEIEIPPGSFSFCNFFFWRSKRKSWTAAVNFRPYSSHA